MKAATGQMRLHLLMLNCGMTQVDVASLGRDEVDWVRGRIKRMRTKTKEQEKAPVMEYPLWHETFALLKGHQQTEGELVLRPRRGSDGSGTELIPRVGGAGPTRSSRITSTSRRGSRRA